MTTREEAERISETEDVASAIGYLVESHSANAAVDLVHAVMDAVRVGVMRKGLLRTDNIEFNSWLDSSLAVLDVSSAYAAWLGATRRLENRVAEIKQENTELAAAVDNLLKVFDEADPEVNCYVHGAIDALRTIRKEKP